MLPKPRPKIFLQDGFVVVIDAGHGGHDPGANIGLGNGQLIAEKDITLSMAKALGDALHARNIHHVFTREDDRYVGLQERVDLAKKFGGNLLVSLHVNSAPRKTASGISIYTLSDQATDDLAADFAMQENNALGIPKERAQISSQRTQKKITQVSDQLATGMIMSVAGHGEILERPLRKANFVVLRAYNMPAVLVELGFLSHPGDLDLLFDPAWRSKTSTALADAIMVWQRKVMN